MSSPMTPEEREQLEAQRDELEAELAGNQQALDDLARKLDSSPDDFGDEDEQLDADIRIATLTIYADGHYEAEWWCPVDPLLMYLAEAVQSMLEHRDEMAAESKRLGYGS
ncbi:hypothetical protein ACFVUS_12670 [Nocardia sp. NPDC058058]|uniref:hypothetical protein n=1 Tax=Nocardia sp. NPDC058058 TaxID=3346317 RepID=UPI0036DB8964